MKSKKRSIKVRAGVGAAALAAVMAGVTAGASPAAADPPTNCGGYEDGSTYRYNNCSYYAKRLKVDFAYGGDFMVCAHGKENVYISGQGYRVRSVTVDYTYPGPIYYPTCPYDA